MNENNRKNKGKCTKQTKGFQIMIILCIVTIILPFELSAKRLGIVRTKQEQSNWCWAAATQMVLSNYNIVKTQTEIVTKIKGSAVNQTAVEAEIKRAFEMGIKASSEKVLSVDRIRTDADRGRPFVFAWYWTSGGGHALVYDGYVDSSYYVHDPWQENATKAYSYNSLKTAGGKGTWKTSICSLQDKNPTALTSKSDVLQTKYSVMNIMISSSQTIQLSIPDYTGIYGIDFKLYSLQGKLVRSFSMSSTQPNLWGPEQTNTSETLSKGKYSAYIKIGEGLNTLWKNTSLVTVW